MADLPSGVVTFLFTDIEGSTELVDTLAERYPALLQRHHELMRGVIAAHGGFEVGTEGDAFFVVFTSPAAAVRAAVEAQQLLSAERWHPRSTVRVRMGLHTGEAVLGGDNYVGMDVHRASRIASAGYGGQILLSDATRTLVAPALPGGTRLDDLGSHRLKGLPGPERIFQVTVEGLPSGFPPLASLEVRPNNLPRLVTSFVGRKVEVHEVTDRLSSARLITLTGPGGTGKTRLAIRVAEEVIADYEHGCWFVALDALRDPELVPSTIAGALDLRVPPDRSVMTTLEEFLAHRELLLVLDNFEQVSAAAPYLGELLRAAPRLRLLTTSRAPLHIHGEQEYPVPPLGILPERGTAFAPTAESLSQYEAVQLFIERAVAVKPDFRVTNANAPAVAEICVRLDGLPLAIELAAARIKLLTPEEMLGRLQQSLSILSSSAQDLPERQRTLLGAIEWSHGLLSEPEQRLFARLSVFRGGFTLEAADIVCGGDELGIDALVGVGALLDMSLLRSEEQAAETWFRMLETMRAYASDRLAESGELGTIAVRHGRHFFGLAALAEGHLNGPDQLEWLERLGREQDNLRAAWSRAADVGLLGPALRAAGAIWRFWQLRSQFSEARATFERLLALPGAAAGDRAKALIGAGGIAYWQGDFESMARHYREARELSESAGDLAVLADALYNESYVPLLLEGDADAARSLLNRALDLYRQTGNAIGVAEAESSLGFSHFFIGELQAAIPFQERAVRAYRAAKARWQLSESLLGLSTMYAQAGDWKRAIATMRESLALARELGVEVGVAMIVEWAGASAGWVGDHERGARLLGKADEMKKGLGAAAPSQLVQTEAQRSRARDALGEDRYEQLRSDGAHLSTADAIRLVEQFEPPPNAPPAPSPRPLGMAARGGEAGEAM